ncbi:MAG: S-methyl-5'-thioadenosine phosphorylase [Phycisphaeraceae bacterium]|nr:S-methyl-5'-thioadenosine phosphorylase [Phycisphaeraceae bacterium]
MANLKIGIIGGTGLGDALGGQEGKLAHVQTPFGPPSSPIVQTRWQGVDIAILQRHGPGHVYPPSFVPFRANIFALKALGVTHVIASGATGSLRQEIAPGDLVIADQIIDKTHRRAGTFFEKAAVHVEFAEPFCPVTRHWLITAAAKLSPAAGGDFRGKVHAKGTYVCMEGPAFSTRAESMMHRAWGGDLIGMTAMPEAKLAREAEMAYALIALPTDYDCWRPRNKGESDQQLLAEILGNLKQASDAGIALIRQALSDVSTLEAHPSPAHDSLKMAIWSQRDKIDPAEIERLGTIWGRYFNK